MKKIQVSIAATMTKTNKSVNCSDELALEKPHLSMLMLLYM